MPTYAFVTLDVFTDRPFGGNPLAVFTDARGMTDAQMLALAGEMNLSETTFVLPPENPAHTARVRIFHRNGEMPFAGHPSIGTGYVLAAMGHEGALTLEMIAGLVKVDIDRDAAGAPTGAVIAAPQALTTGREIPPQEVAACAGLAVGDVVTATHAPVLATVGVPFIIAEVGAEALSRAEPDVAAFRKAEAGRPDLAGRYSLLIYVREGEQIRARMFAPLAGTHEDPATGSANATLAALLVSLSGVDQAAFTISQGVEMGRPSVLKAAARRTPDGVRATVGGGCAPMFRGEVTL
ncbi:PhzF family phenazine biosynthesis protein [Phenylobacterium sp.]|uniref:PhzF family phenazine biosynthesis protein n=1 Tax=Phenylobacterium sp. TaxID=1871053 RepID=UPI00271E0DFB|nr:PhzF family phenazine biosynthesis protein [Phenylobacterium sp.]MDO8378280.1 PhzF family phenazine biosynthesis protein [Phenylobacterium sp.]